MVDLVSPQPSFLGFPAASSVDEIADFGILGIPYGVPYGPAGLHSDAANAPGAVRRRSFRLAAHADKYDWDLGGTMLGGTEASVLDYGDVEGTLLPEVNRDTGYEAVRRLLAHRTLPVILGGDDSVPAIALSAYQEFGPVNVLQIDAHIDFRDEVNGNREGYSSPMRRIREMPWVNRIVQVGARGTGSAYPQDVEDARAAGNILITADQVHEEGISSVTRYLDASAPWFVTVDIDGLDPSEAPGTSAPLPGGLRYHQLRRILAHVATGPRLAGIDFVEHFPSLDVRDSTSMVIARLIVNAIGFTARNDGGR